MHNPAGRERYTGYIKGDPTWCPVADAGCRCRRPDRLDAADLGPPGPPRRHTRPDGRHWRCHHASGLSGARHRDQVDGACRRVHMRDDGYDLGLLFSAIPARFYLRLGWCCVPLTGFRAELRLSPNAGSGRALGDPAVRREPRPGGDGRALSASQRRPERHDAASAPVLGLCALPRSGRVARHRRPQPVGTLWLHELGAERTTTAPWCMRSLTTIRPALDALVQCVIDACAG